MKTTTKPTGNSFPVLRQICNLVPRPVFNALCTSVGGFSQSNVIATASFDARGTAGYGTITFSLALPSTGYDSLTGSVEFRLYAYGAKYSQPVEMSTFELRSNGGY